MVSVAGTFLGLPLDGSTLATAGLPLASTLATAVLSTGLPLASTLATAVLSTGLPLASTLATTGLLVLSPPFTLSPVLTLLSATNLAGSDFSFKYFLPAAFFLAANSA